MNWSKFNDEVQKVLQEVLRQTKGLRFGPLEDGDDAERLYANYSARDAKWTIGIYECEVKHADLSIAADAFVRMWQIKYKVENF